MKLNTLTGIVAGLTLMALGMGVSAQNAGGGQGNSAGGQISEAARAAAKDAATDLAKSGVTAGKTLTVLPFAGDQGAYVEGALKNELTAAKLAVVEGSDSPQWNTILKEIGWNERKADMMDPKTLVTFGKLQGTQFLLYGSVRDFGDDGRKAYVELELHVISIETKRHVWGKTSVGRIYRRGSEGDQIQGVLQLEEVVRVVLQKTVESGAASVKSAMAQRKNLTVAVLPVAGDVDRYVTELTKQMLTKAGVAVRELDAPTVGDAQLMVDEQPELAGAFLTGALRDLYKQPVRETMDGSEFKLGAEIQLKMQDAKTGAILWTDTLRASDTLMEKKQNVVEAAAVTAVRDKPQYLLWIAASLGGLLVLGFAFSLLSRAR